MNLLERLSDIREWHDFLTYKAEAGNLPERELEDLFRFVTARKYETVVDKIRDGSFFVLPVRKEVNKKNTDKKRIVYSFPFEEATVFKLLAYLLHEYDGIFSKGLFSFRRDIGVKNAITALKDVEAEKLYTYKTDIHNYFNSIPIDKLIPVLRDTLKDDMDTAVFLEKILNNPYVISEGKKIEDPQKGIMAGTPTASFLANLYLKEMDEYFAARDVIYMRYSDDVIILADSREKLNDCKSALADFLVKFGLTVNESKVVETEPGEEFTFLGFAFRNGEVDIAPVSIDKLKAKMRRKARSLYRWKQRKNADDMRTVRAFLRTVNKKLYENAEKNELTWCRWYFPQITTDVSLHALDKYIIELARFLVTGKHTKKNYDFRYDELKACGFRSLVNEYYKEHDKR